MLKRSLTLNLSNLKLYNSLKSLSERYWVNVASVSQHSLKNDFGWMVCFCNQVVFTVWTHSVSPRPAMSHATPSNGSDTTIKLPQRDIFATEQANMKRNRKQIVWLARVVRQHPLSNEWEEMKSSVVNNSVHLKCWKLLKNRPQTSENVKRSGFI